MSSKIKVNEIEGFPISKTVYIPTGTGNTDEWVQDLFTGRKRLKIYPEDLILTGMWEDARNHGDEGTQSAIEDAIAAIGSDSALLLLSPGVWSILTSLAIPDNVILFPVPGCIINITDGKTLTVRHIFGERFPLFTGLGRVAGLSECKAEWFGVKPSESSANNATYMQKAVNAVSAGGLLTLTFPGTYNCSSYISVTYSDIEVYLGRGVVWDITNSGGTRLGFLVTGSLKATTWLSSSVSMGVLSCMVNNPAGISAGDPIFFRYSTSKGLWDWSEVSSLAASTIQLKYPLSYAFDPALGGGVVVESVTTRNNVKISGPGQIIDSNANSSTRLVRFRYAFNCAVEDISMEVSSSTGNFGRGVEFGGSSNQYAAFCKAKNLHIEGNPHSGIYTDLGCISATIKENAIARADTNGLYITGVKNLVEGNRVGRAYSGSGLYINEGRDSKFLSNILKNGTYGINVQVTDKLKNILISDNSANGFTYGLYLVGDATRSECSGITIGPNNLEDNTYPMYVAEGIGSDLDLGQQRLIFMPGSVPSCRYGYFGEGVTITGTTDKTPVWTGKIPAGSIGPNGGFRLIFLGEKPWTSGIYDYVWIDIGTFSANYLAYSGGPHTQTFTVEFINKGATDAQTIQVVNRPTNLFGVESNEQNSGSYVDTAIEDIDIIISADLAVTNSSWTLRNLTIEPLGHAL